MIRLQFSFQDNLPSELITYFGHGAGFSHVDAVMDDGRLLGARLDGGVQIRPAGYAAFTRTLPVTLGAAASQNQEFWDFLNQQIGKPYDSRAVIGFAAGRDWREATAWFCSELVAAALESSYWFPYDLTTPVNKIDPDDLLLAISARAEISLG